MPRRTPHGAPPALDAWGDADDEAAWAAAGGGGDDTWAERLWADMESHRRQVRNQVGSWWAAGHTCQPAGW